MITQSWWQRSTVDQQRKYFRQFPEIPASFFHQFGVPAKLHGVNDVPQGSNIQIFEKCFHGFHPLAFPSFQ